MQGALEYRDNIERRKTANDELYESYASLATFGMVGTYANLPSPGDDNRESLIGPIQTYHSEIESQRNSAEFNCKYYLCVEPNDNQTIAPYKDVPGGRDLDLSDEDVTKVRNNYQNDIQPDGTLYFGTVDSNGYKFTFRSPNGDFNQNETAFQRNYGLDLQAAIDRINTLYEEIYGPNGVQSKIEQYEEEHKNDKYNFTAIVSGAPTWDEARVYQRYIQDEAIKADMGIGESTVEEYHARLNERLDNSYLGIMSRYTGMRKDYIMAVLDGMEILDWIAQYEPAEFAPTPVEHVDEPDHQFEEDKFDSTTYVAYFNQTFFEDRRQRNYAA